VEFEFDPDKSASNKAKHGIDFEEAQALWNDGRGIEIPAKSDTEERFARIARIDDKVWIAFYTLREARIRIISVRRARESEEDLYDSGRT